MGQYKTLKEIRKIFIDDVVEPEFRNFSPSDCWVVMKRRLNTDSGEYVTESSLNMNLYLILSKILEEGYSSEPALRLYELCVTAGQGSSSVLETCYLKDKNDSDSCWIQYEGPFVKGAKISNCMPSVQPLALESISIITELARKNDLNKLLEIKNYLVYFKD
jgi:hypothetical protein